MRSWDDWLHKGSPDSDVGLAPNWKVTMKQSWSAFNIPNLSGKLAVVTGGNAGLGIHTVHQLLMHGADVIVASRSVERGEAAVAELGPQRGHAEVLPLDLADLSSVRAFADEVKAKHDKIDLLINNAGVMMTDAAVTKDGFELQFGTNHLGHFALTGLLIDQVLAAPNSRIVNLSSLAHNWGDMGQLPNAGLDEPYKKVRAYGRSKLANLLFTFELQRRFAAMGTDTIALAAHPGSAGTGLANHLLDGRFTRVLQAPMKAVLTQPAEAGALPTLRAATDTAVFGGQYFGPDGLGEQRGAPVVVAAKSEAYDAGLARDLWAQSSRLTEVNFLD